MKLLWIYIGILFGIISSCNNTSTPKPHGFLRIELPIKEYRVLDTNILPFSFEIPKYSNIKKKKSDSPREIWFDLEFPSLNAVINFTYRPLNKDLSSCIEDTRKFAYKHSIKADAIKEQVYVNKENKVLAISYKIEGNVASFSQFFATDSTKNFLRGALYFQCTPNKDSLAPAEKFLDKDIKRIIETLKWKKI